MLKIESLFSHRGKAENALKDLNAIGIQSVSIKTVKPNEIYASVPYGTYGAAYNDTLYESNVVSMPFIGILQAAKPYAGLHNDENPNIIGFLPDLNAECVSLKISVDTEKLHEATSILARHKGKKINIIK